MLHKFSVEEDKCLSLAAKRGDKSAFTQLYMADHDKVTSTMKKKFRSLSEEEIEECVQQAYTNAYKSIKSFRAESRFSTWVTRIAINVFKQSLKDKQNDVLSNAVRVDDYAEDGEGDNLRDTMFAKPSNDLSLQPMQIVAGREGIKNLIKLSDEWRKEGSNFYVGLEMLLETILDDDVNYKSLAEKNDIPIGTVRSRIFRAREAVMETLEL